MRRSRQRLGAQIDTSESSRLRDRAEELVVVALDRLLESFQDLQVVLAGRKLLLRLCQDARLLLRRWQEELLLGVLLLKRPADGWHDGRYVREAVRERGGEGWDGERSRRDARWLGGSGDRRAYGKGG